MGYFAQLDESGLVLQVISISNGVLQEPHLSFPDTESFGQEYIMCVLGLTGEWRQTSFNNNFRGRYAGIGYTYDSQRDEFIAPQPFPSWLLDENGDWQPPVPVPDDNQRYEWNDSSLSWVQIA